MHMANESFGDSVTWFVVVLNGWGVSVPGRGGSPQHSLEWGRRGRGDSTPGQRCEEMCGIQCGH